jgi:hypothetical protein
VQSQSSAFSVGDVSDDERADHHNRATGTSTADRVPLRLVLSSSLDAGRLDGAWWPQSRDLRVEFADLADNLPDRLGRAVNIAYSKSCWDPSPTWLPVGRSRLVRSRAFLGTADPHRVLLRLDSHRSIDLMVVPPDFDADSAADVMRAAASPANELPARTLLNDASAALREATSDDVGEPVADGVEEPRG